MDDLVATALSAGVTVLLVSGGRGLYRRMGCIDAGSYRTVRVPRAAVRPEAGRVVREWRLADVPRMAGLHRAEPVRFERTEPEWYALLRTGLVADRPCRTWVVSAPGRPEEIEAYLCVQQAVETPQGRVASVQEVAGSRDCRLHGARPGHGCDARRPDRRGLPRLGPRDGDDRRAARPGGRPPRASRAR